MLRSRFVWKLYAGYALLIILTTAVVGFLVANRIQKDSMEELESSLFTKAILIRDIAAPVLEGELLRDLQGRVESLGREAGIRISIVDAEGAVIADSFAPPTKGAVLAGKPEFQQAREQGRGKSIRISTEGGVETMYVVAAVTNDTEVTGYVRAALPMTSLHEQLAELRNIVILGAIVAAIVGLVLGLFFARRITEPLVSIADAAESIAAGNYDLEVRYNANDEIGRLATSFNSMARHLRDRIGTIARERNQVLAILSSMVEGVVAVNADQQVVHMNAAAANTLDVVGGDCIGKSIWACVRASAVVEATDQVMRERSEVTREAVITTRSNERIFEIHAAPIEGPQGELGGAVILLFDLTELRRLERVRRDFVANVSHELKTPLAAIKGMVETIIGDSGMPNHTRERFLARVKVQTERLTSIVLDLLTLSRLESDESVIEHAPVDLVKAVGRSITLHTTASEEKSQTLHTDLGHEALMVGGDPEAIQQVVGNLLVNAIRYTPEGGDIWVRLRRDKETAIIEVEDTGIGIEAKHLNRIFERFYRVDKDRSREVGGTGLGLAIVKHITTAMGGRVTADSTVGVGSTFSVYLPLTTLTSETKDNSHIEAANQP